MRGGSIDGDVCGVARGREEKVRQDQDVPQAVSRVLRCVSEPLLLVICVFMYLVG